MIYHAPVSAINMGQASILNRQIEIINRVANCSKNVLILGETGTGKDFTAKRIHEMSEKKDKPFVAINCASIPEELFEAELFGYARGSFTGAIKEKQGLFETAKDGTIFLDEIGELSSYLQAKILRVIEEREIRRVGEILQRKVLARFIFATNKELPEEVRQGRFRKDLYFRISVVKFYLPPLRERKEQIPLLVGQILERENRKQRAKKEISPLALKKLMSYDFPGNIRELENILERACVFSKKSRITAFDIRLDSELSQDKRKTPLTSEQLIMTLENCRWNKTKAALEIGRSRRQLYRLLERNNMADCIKKSAKSCLP